MPETNETVELAFNIPDSPAGTLIGTEVCHKPKLKLTEQEITALRELVRTAANRDMPARREEVIRVWEKRLFDRGYQHLLPRPEGGWVLPAVGTGYSREDERSIFETNIYNSYSQILIGALTREIPKTIYTPRDPDKDADITAADSAETINEDISRRICYLKLMIDMARLLCTDGRAVFVTDYVRDAQKLGYEDPAAEELEEEAVPETEAGEEEEAEEIEEEREEEEEEQAAGGESEASNEEGKQGKEGEGDEGEEEGEESETESRQPRGQERTRVFGALEAKLPIKEDELSTMPYLQIAHEIDINVARAQHPEKAGTIVPGAGGPGGDDIDRLARVNVRLGVFDQFVTTDTTEYDTTEVVTWFRPAFLLGVPQEEVRNSLLKKAGGNGIRVIFCGEAFCEARAISLDEQCSLVHALPGDGAHRAGLCDWLVPIQKVLNNWLELSDDYFVHGVPAKWGNQEVFDFEKLRDQINMPGEWHPLDVEDGVNIAEQVFEETATVYPEALAEFIDKFTNALAQLLCGAFPALFGGDETATDTAAGYKIQRDQALGRLGIPWKQIKETVARVKGQAVRYLASNHKASVKTKVGDAIQTIEMADLRGEFQAWPETDENLPKTYTERENQLTKLWTDAATNPQVAELVFNPDNLELLKHTIALTGFYLPIVAARDKQLGENVRLLREEMIPNPVLAKSKEDLLAAHQKAAAAAKAGEQPDPALLLEIEQLLATYQQQIKTLPPMTSSVLVDEEVDDHASEAATALKLLISPKGRRLANGDDEDKAHYQNLRQHFIEHKQAAAKQQAAAAKPGKPPSLSANIKDMPPKEAAATLTAAGIPADVKDFEQAEVAAAAEKHPGPGGIQIKQ